VLYSNKTMFKKLGLFLVVLMTVALLLPMATAGVAGAAISPANNAVQFLYNDYTNNGINNSEVGVGSYALYVLYRAGVDVSTWARYPAIYQTPQTSPRFPPSSWHRIWWP